MIQSCKLYSKKWSIDYLNSNFELSKTFISPFSGIVFFMLFFFYFFFFFFFFFFLLNLLSTLAKFFRRRHIVIQYTYIQIDMIMKMKMKSHFEDKLHFDYNTVTHLHFHNLSLRSYFQTIHINKVQSLLKIKPILNCLHFLIQLVPQVHS